MMDRKFDIEGLDRRVVEMIRQRLKDEETCDEYRAFAAGLAKELVSAGLVFAGMDVFKRIQQADPDDVMSKNALNILNNVLQ